MKPEDAMSKRFWDQECQQCPGGTDCTTCHKTRPYNHTVRMGVLTANCIRRAVRDGIRHFNTITGKELKHPEEIIKSLLENGSVILLNPPEQKVAK